MPGPAPKRSDMRARTNKPDTPIVGAPIGNVTIPDSEEEWCHAAKQWYESLAESGQSVWYTSSDWSYAYIIAELLDEALTAPKKNGQLISALLTACNDLLTTEGARRKMRVELQRETPVDLDAERASATVTDLRKRLTAQ